MSFKNIGLSNPWPRHFPFGGTLKNPFYRPGRPIMALYWMNLELVFMKQGNIIHCYSKESKGLNFYIRYFDIKIYCWISISIMSLKIDMHCFWTQNFCKGRFLSKKFAHFCLSIHKLRWQNFEDFWHSLPPSLTSLTHKLMLYRWHLANSPSSLLVNVVYEYPLIGVENKR